MPRHRMGSGQQTDAKLDPGRRLLTLILSLLRKEFVFKPRDKWFHAKRLSYIAIGGVIVLGVYIQQLVAHGTKAGLIMFEWLSMLVVVSACLIGPFMATNAIVSEKESRTLSLLMMSEISTWQLLISKLISSIVTTFLTVIAVVPLFILCESLGGITNTQVLLAFPVLLTTVVCGACMGLFLSAFIDQELRVQGFVGLASVAFFGFLPAAVWAIAALAFSVGTAEKTLTVVSPLMAMMAIKNEQNLTFVWWNCAYNLLISLPFVPMAIYTLPRLYTRPGGLRRIVHELMLKLRLTRIRQVRRAPRPSIFGNPVTWKDLHVHYGGERSSWLTCALTCIGIGGLGGLVYALMTHVSKNMKFEHLGMWEYALLAITVFAAVSYIYGAISRAAQCCSREKAGRTLELLLTTDVSGYSIVMGKSNAISLTLLPWIVTFIVSSLGYLFVSLARLGTFETNVVLIVAGATLNVMCMVFAYEYIAMYLSLKLRTFSTASALAGFVAWFVVGNLILGMAGALFAVFTVYISLIAFPTVGPVIIGNHFRLRLIDEFHEMAMKSARPTESTES